MTKTRHTNIVASFLVLMKDNQVLLQKRENTGYHDGHYGLVSGHVEQSETFTQAIIREAKEEAGIEIKPDQIQAVHIMHRKSNFDGSERVDVYFLTTDWTGQVTNHEPHKCSQLKWFEIDQLPTDMIGSVKAALLKIIDQVHYSEHGWE